MLRAADVAAFVRTTLPTAQGMRLQKLLYYAQAWSLVWDKAPLFREPIEAWKNGPVVAEFWREERAGQKNGDPNALSDAQRATVCAVLEAYGPRSGAWLSSLTHRERPWVDARGGLPDSVSCDAEIDPSSMAGYYGGLAGVGFKAFSPAFIRGLEVVAALPLEELEDLRDDASVPADAFMHWLDTGDEDECAP